MKNRTVEYNNVIDNSPIEENKNASRNNKRSASRQGSNVKELNINKLEAMLPSILSTKNNIGGLGGMTSYGRSDQKLMSKLFF